MSPLSGWKAPARAPSTESIMWMDVGRQAQILIRGASAAKGGWRPGASREVAAVSAWMGLPPGMLAQAEHAFCI
jgi:hypothetical protein